MTTDHAAEVDDEGRGATFADLALQPEVLRTLSELGYEEPTPIQRQAIPHLLEGRDLLGQAATGTGKTAAFALPALERIAQRDQRQEPTVVVLVPTRELAVQVCEALHRYGRDIGTRSLPIYGGQPIGRQLRALGAGVDVVVATPGRARDHITRGTLRLDHIEMVVLDEADEMLDMGFAEDIEAILEHTPDERQTVLFSATMPRRIETIARRHLREPVRIELGREPSTADDAALIEQAAYVVPRAHKAAALGRLLDVEDPTAALVFCRTREQVEQLTSTLNGRGYRAEALHGGMDQQQRDRVMARLRSGSVDLLVATDVAARGLDVEQLTHVVNYDVPAGPDAYVHRIGRVGRAGREGTAITLLEPREHRMLKTIERVTKQRIKVEKLPTVADLRARRLDLTRAALREALVGEDLERFRVVVEPLADEFDVMEVALAAVKLIDEASGAASAEEAIPEVAAPAEKPKRPRRAVVGRDGRRSRATTGDMTRLFVGVGRNGGVRPQDLVGAIAGETRLSGHDIGAIEVADRYSLVEVPESAVDDVITAMRTSRIKGKRANIRRERY